MVKQRIRFARGTEAQRALLNSEPFDAGVPIYCTDSNKLYISDGVTAPANLLPVGLTVNAESVDNVDHAHMAVYASADESKGTIESRLVTLESEIEQLISKVNDLQEVYVALGQYSTSGQNQLTGEHGIATPV